MVVALSGGPIRLRPGISERCQHSAPITLATRHRTDRIGTTGDPYTIVAGQRRPIPLMTTVDMLPAHSDARRAAEKRGLILGVLRPAQVTDDSCPQSVALAHDLLAVTKERSNVNFDAYLRSLCRNLPQRPEIAIQVEAQQVSIPIDRAVPAGLIVNELVTNSIKYAFGNSGGRILVNFGLIGNQSEACVAVQDDGKGLELPPKKGSA